MVVSGNERRSKYTEISCGKTAEQNLYNARVLNVVVGVQVVVDVSVQGDTIKAPTLSHTYRSGFYTSPNTCIRCTEWEKTMNLGYNTEPIKL